MDILYYSFSTLHHLFLLEYKKKKHDSLCISLAENFKKIAVPRILNVDKTDIQIINSEFLVDNIESALRIWNEKGYKTDKDFDFF